MDLTIEPVTTRPFESDDDFYRVRDLLTRTYPVTPLDSNWDVRRWDGWRFYRPDANWDPRWRDRVRLWQTPQGKLVGAAHPEEPGEVHLQLDPGWRHLEGQMVAWAEATLAEFTNAASGRRTLTTIVFEDDILRGDLLARRGWERTSSSAMVRRLRLPSGAPGSVSIAAGYRLRTTRAEGNDSQRIADLLNAAFQRNFHTAGEHVTLAAHAPSFRRETDLVAEAPDGSLACYVGAPYDDVNRRGILEPVGTHPDHRRRGLARTLVRKAMARLRGLGAAEVTVGTGDARAAHRFYESLGFTEKRRGRVWRYRR